MKNIILIAFLIFMTNPAEACVAPSKKINLSKTSLEKNPITVRGKSIYFDQGTPDEAKFEFNLEEKKWCVKTPDKTEWDCKVQYPTFVINSKKETYANIDVKANKLTVYPVDKNEKKINSGKTYIDFTDSSNDVREQVEVVSSFGGKLTVSRHRGTRGVVSKSAGEDILDLSEKISESSGCGSSSSAQKNESRTSN